jgi:hypothetical protein
MEKSLVKEEKTAIADGLFCNLLDSYFTMMVIGRLQMILLPCTRAQLVV